MPEGPEVRRDADRIDEAMAGRIAEEVFFGLGELKRYESRLTGLEVLKARPRGKALVISFQDDWNVYSHNLLYGKWFVRRAGNDPETNRQLRLAIRNSDFSALLYSASDIEVLRTGELDDHDYLSKLGPDPINDDLEEQDVLKRLRDARFRNRQLAMLLLDQEFFAGIGNYLRCDICFDAGLHPTTRPADCSADQLERLAESILKIPRRSYLTGGLTNDPGRVEKMKEQGREPREYRRLAYKRRGQPCHECGAEIVREKLSGRNAYFCPECQTA